MAPYATTMLMAMLAIAPGTVAGAAEGTGGAGFGGSPPTTTTTPTPTPTAPVGATVDPSGGQVFGSPDPSATPTVPGFVAKLLPDGTAAAPALAPETVKQAIWAGNDIIGLPYVRGGGHDRSFRAKGYDCSGAISYALHGGGLLGTPRDSTAFMRWGVKGAGSWVTVYTARSHAYLVVAGLRLDTSAAGDPSNAKGPRWRPLRRSNHGYKGRHPVGL